MAEKSANIIELNGKRYDAHTGRLLNAATPVSSPKKIPHLPQAATTRVVKPTPHTAANPVKAPIVKTRSSVQRPSPNNVSRHKAQKPQTLMRRATAKPQAGQMVAAKLKVQAPAVRAVGTIAVQPKLSISGINPHHKRAAAQTQKSPAVQKFSKPAVFAPQKRLQPAASAVSPAKQSQAEHKKAFFEKAIANATSHEAVKAPRTKKTSRLKNSLKRQKSVFMVAASASVLVIVGAFVAFSNMSTLELKVASMRAGVNVNLPAYQPDGFSKSGPIAYQSGKVTVGFRANDSSGREYKLSQEESPWNSETLYDSVVATNKEVQTVQQNGNTVYLYGDSEASWVSGGILHTITGNANLSTDQLLKIASNV